MLEQLDLFGEEVLPVLRKEYAAPAAHVPEPPTHAGRVAEALATQEADTAASRRGMAAAGSESPVRARCRDVVAVPGAGGSDA